MLVHDWYTYKQQESQKILQFSTEPVLLRSKDVFPEQKSFTVSSLLIVTLELLTFPLILRVLEKFHIQI